MADADAQDKNEAGCKCSTLFGLAQSDPLVDLFIQYIQSKQPTMIHMGIPPPHPGPQPDDMNVDDISQDTYAEWKIKTDRFAIYYLAAFRPEEECYSGKIRGLQYDWTTFCHWIQELESSHHLIDKYQLKAVTKVAFALTISNRHRDLINCLHHRDAEK